MILLLSRDSGCVTPRLSVLAVEPVVSDSVSFIGGAWAMSLHSRMVAKPESLDDAIEMFQRVAVSSDSRGHLDRRTALACVAYGVLPHRHCTSPSTKEGAGSWPA